MATGSTSEKHHFCVYSCYDILRLNVASIVVHFQYLFVYVLGPSLSQPYACDDSEARVGHALQPSATRIIPRRPSSSNMQKKEKTSSTRVLTRSAASHRSATLSQSAPHHTNQSQHPSVRPVPPIQARPSVAAPI